MHSYTQWGIIMGTLVSNGKILSLLFFRKKIPTNKRDNAALNVAKFACLTYFLCCVMTLPRNIRSLCSAILYWCLSGWQVSNNQHPFWRAYCQKSTVNTTRKSLWYENFFQIFVSCQNFTFQQDHMPAHTACENVDHTQDFIHHFSTMKQPGIKFRVLQIMVSNAWGLQRADQRRRWTELLGTNLIGALVIPQSGSGTRVFEHMFKRQADTVNTDWAVV